MASSIGQSMVSAWNMGADMARKAVNNPVGTLNIVAGLGVTAGTAAAVYGYGCAALPAVMEAIPDDIIHIATAYLRSNPSPAGELVQIGMHSVRMVQLLYGSEFGVVIGTTDFIVHAISNTKSVLSYFYQSTTEKSKND